jgi:ABC-type Na+ transport system ATPase subunit NatA
MLEVDIEHRLGTFALDVHFRSGRGLTALFGRSGGGRTSVVNTIAGLIAPRFEAGAVLSARVAAHDARWGLTELAGAFGRRRCRGRIYRSALPCACESVPAT